MGRLAFGMMQALGGQSFYEREGFVPLEERLVSPGPAEHPQLRRVR